MNCSAIGPVMGSCVAQQQKTALLLTAMPALREKNIASLVQAA